MNCIWILLLLCLCNGNGTKDDFQCLEEHTSSCQSPRPQPRPRPLFSPERDCECYGAQMEMTEDDCD